MNGQTQMPYVACDYNEGDLALMNQRDHLRALASALTLAADAAQNELSARLAGDPRPWRTLAPAMAAATNANPEVAGVLIRQGFLG